MITPTQPILLAGHQMIKPDAPKALPTTTMPTVYAHHHYNAHSGQHHIITLVLHTYHAVVVVVPIS